MKERVAITGLGIISPLGVGREAFSAALEQGALGFKDELLAPEIVRAVGRVGELVPTSVRLQSSKASQIDVISRYAVESCGQALKDARLELTEEQRDRTGVLLGTAYGCLESNMLFDQYQRAEDGRPTGVSPLYFKSTVSNAAAGWVSILLKLRGVNATFTSGVLAGAQAVAHGADLIADGITDLVLTGGADRTLPLNMLLETPEGVPSSEGACALALESMSRAVSRGATVYGRLRGTFRMSLPDGELATLTVEALKALGTRPNQLTTLVVPETDPVKLEALKASVHARTGLELQLWPLKQQLGECRAAWSVLAVAAVCLRFAAAPENSRGVVYVLDTEPGLEGVVLELSRT